jgi:beta-aspartyl-peptidase (threonine type)
MDGRTRNCGSVTGLQNIKNPIKAARAVMDSSEHVFFSGSGARAFALEQGLEWVDSTYFETERRMKQYEKRMEKFRADIPSEKQWKYGTVGCVVLDRTGDLAAGTSTGGMSMKRNGRIGDSPVIGAGTYADNSTCAVSCTGWGEYFIRAAVAHDVHARMAYGGASLSEAAYSVIQEVIPDMGGNGGLIAIDNNGNVTMEFNTSGMFRAASDSNGKRGVSIFSED